MRPVYHRRPHPPAGEVMTGVDFMLVCPHGGCQDPTCEDCAVTAMRADRLVEIEAKAALLKEELAS